jgi:predicted nucleic acid-binding protein
VSVVLDASAAGPILIPDESRALLPGLVEALADCSAVVPPHWRLEIGNLLLVARRRGRLSEADLKLALGTLLALSIEEDAAASTYPEGTVWTVAERYGLTLYDAAYLELAARLSLPLATSDSALLRAATEAGVGLFGR